MDRRGVSILIALAACGGKHVCAPGQCPWPAYVDASQCGGDDGSVHYRSSTPDELASERELFRRVLAAAPDGRAAVEPLVAEANAQSLDLVICDDTVVITERPSARRGRGIYVVRLGRAEDTLVEIPHSFSDLHTLPLGEDFFELSHARVLAVSTVHRRGQAGYFDDDIRKDHGYADVAHDPQSTFQAMTLAWLAVFPDRPVIQLHGFADRRVGVDVVISAGEPSPRSRSIRDHLHHEIAPYMFAAFPDDVDDLGATTNSQGKAIRAAGGVFVHVEMSATLRKSLRRRSGDREKFLGALHAAVGSALTQR